MEDLLKEIEKRLEFSRLSRPEWMDEIERVEDKVKSCVVELSDEYASVVVCEEI